MLSLFIYLRFVPCNVVDRNWSRKKRAFWQKLAKRTVSNPNWFHFFIFISHSFTWKLTNKNYSFVTIFWKKCWNFGQVPWNCDIGITCWNCQIRPEKNWNWRHAASVPPVLIGNHSFFFLGPGFIDYFFNFWWFHVNVGRKFETLVVSWNAKIQ